MAKTPQKILIIDDEPDIRLYLATALEDNGYKPITAGVGEPVLEITATEKPVLIVLDIMMPMRSGISIYKELRSSGTLPQIPIILITGMAGASEFMETGFRNMVQDENIPLPDGFFEKPVKIEALIQHINVLLGKRSS